ncbi:MAG: peptide chain release factor N(5)-glutamine methyltransferase [candidate division WOR-3 bacterium]|nr:peptide chain release factor N(5)-glutamine methyltransferase [candidate division WOR-3 bacterium]
MQKKWDSKELINEAIDLFKSHDIQKPRLNAELIMVHCMNKNRLELYSNYKKKLTRIEANYFRNLVQRRLRNEPVQYIVGETEFMSLPFKVNRHVLIPRPETEILVEKVLNYVLENKKKDFRILDIGTGSGNIIVSLAKYAPGCRYYASDISRHALDVARDNEQLNEIKGTINFINTKGFEGIKKRKYFHCIVSNPPYIKEKQVKKLQREVCEYEPNLALGSGEDGLNMLKYLIDNAYKYLRKNGMLAMEFGDGQCRSVRNYALKKGKYKDISIVKDLAGKDRIIMMRRK